MREMFSELGQYKILCVDSTVLHVTTDINYDIDLGVGDSNLFPVLLIEMHFFLLFCFCCCCCCFIRSRAVVNNICEHRFCTCHLWPPPLTLTLKL